MIVFCDHKCLDQSLIDRFVIFNLSSLLESFERVDILPPFKMDRYSRDFDIVYANYILENDNVFYSFIKIMMSIYYGLDTIVLVDREDLYEYVTESLIKLLQQRYGIVSNLINEKEDWEFVEDCEFTLQGLYNIDKDKERFAYLYARHNDIN